MKFLCTLICGLLLIAETYATIRRVGFTDFPPITGIDYVSFYLAHQAATNGDTIYVYPGKTISRNGWPGTWNRAEITKRLIIVGKGNWLDSASTPRGNSALQATKGISYFGGAGSDPSQGIHFLSGSEGSVIMGFDGQGQYVVPFANNITIKSNFNLLIWLGNATIANLTVEKNYRVWFSGENSKNFTWTNMTIRNNFIYQFTLPDHSYTGSITNNTLAFDQTGAANGGDLALSYFNNFNSTLSYIYLRDGSWLFQDNLMIFYSNPNAANNVDHFLISGGNGSTFNNNVKLQSNNAGPWPGNGTGNISIPPSQVADIFEAFPAIANSSADGRYQLKANSPAKAGSAVRPTATIDAGMFGGLNPYRLSTIPSIPTIYSIGSPTGNTATGNSIQINISTRSNN